MLAFWPHVRDRRIASTRIRCFQVIDGLRSLGVEAGLYDGEGGAPPGVLVLAKRYDAASLEQAVNLRRATGARLVLDLCDNHIDLVEENEKLRRRREALTHALGQVDHVVASTRALAGHLVRHLPALADRITVIGDSIDEEAIARPGPPGWRVRLRRLKVGWHHRMRGVAPGRRLIWFGNHGSAGVDGGMQDIDLVAPSLAGHHARAPLSLTVVSNNEGKFKELSRGWRFPAVYVPWQPGMVQALAPLHDVSIIPAGINPFTECKSANRAVTSFMSGWAVACTPLPSYVDMFGGLLVDDWQAGLAELMASPAGRARQVESARPLILQTSSIPAIAQQWRTLIQRIQAD